MKVLTAGQMGAVDRATVALGIPDILLMENAGMRVVDFLAERFAPLSRHRIVVFCGKGKNGGDGMVVARQLFIRFHPAGLHVVVPGDAPENAAMLRACGLEYGRAVTPEMGSATLVIDALLGTGLRGPATGPMLSAIREINSAFPAANVVAVDIPSGLATDTGEAPGEFVRADATVTFTALKVCQAVAPACDWMGELRVAQIGTPAALCEDNPEFNISLVEPASFRNLLGPRAPAANKGSFGHVLVVAGSRGKTGAAAMAGIAALRIGAGLVTVASVESAIQAIGGHAPELMAEALAETVGGGIGEEALEQILDLAGRKNLIAIGPGLGTDPETVAVIGQLFADCEQTMVVDADALNAIANTDWRVATGRVRVLTPHPGEMARLTGKSVAEVQSDRIASARELATGRGAHVILKGQRTLLAFPDGRVWINPTGSPALAKGGTGDVLTGLVAGMLAQFPEQVEQAIASAVYLHGLSGELGAREFGDKSLLATDLLRVLPAAIRECTA